MNDSQFRLFGIKIKSYWRCLLTPFVTTYPSHHYHSPPSSQTNPFFLYIFFFLTKTSHYSNSFLITHHCSEQNISRTLSEQNWKWNLQNVPYFSVLAKWFKDRLRKIYMAMKLPKIKKVQKTVSWNGPQNGLPK